MNGRASKLNLVVLLSLTCLLLASIASAQSTTVLKATASTSQPRIGDTLTVQLTISDVANLAGIDILLSWDSSVLELAQASLSLGVESHAEGVLHGNKLNYDFDTLVPGDIYVQEEKGSGSYSLVAQSIGQDTASFTGSGTIAILTFNIKNTGNANLALESEFADHPPPEQSANLIEHSRIVDSVVAVIPEFGSITLLALLIVLATTVLAVSVRYVRKNKV